MKKHVFGQEVKSVETSGSMFNKDVLFVTVQRNRKYKMNLTEIFKFHTDFNNLVFDIVPGKKKGDWDYLQVSESTMEEVV